MITCSALFLRFAPLESGSEKTTDVLLRLKTSWLGDKRRSSVVSAIAPSALRRSSLFASDDELLLLLDQAVALRRQELEVLRGIPAALVAHRTLDRLETLSREVRCTTGASTCQVVEQDAQREHLAAVAQLHVRALREEHAEVVAPQRPQLSRFYRRCAFLLSQCGAPGRSLRMLRGPLDRSVQP
jgi:hypothetical protein